MKTRLSICLVIAGLGLGGCSYHPLYAKPDSGSNVASALSDVGVPPLSTRAGQLVRNGLLSGMGGGNGSRYALNLTVTEKSSLVSSISKSVVDRHRYRLTVEYVLLESASGRELSNGKTFSVVGYDTVQEPVADLQAAETARERAAGEVAQDLRTRISAYFSTHG